jgi:nucleoside triphosphate diphosphatase
LPEARLDAPALIDALNDRAARPEPLTIGDFLTLMAVLRDPVHGCPWDIEQSFATIAPYTIEEAYEVADAIARGGMAELKDELGDLLLQVVYHAQMADEAGEFDFAGVADAAVRKLIRRHPHVFGDAEARAAGAVRGLWDRVKTAEAEAKREAAGGLEEPAMLLDGIPLALPALTRSVKIQAKAAKVGFDWPDAASILPKLREEFVEFEQEVLAGNQEKMQEEFGDFLFVVSNLARALSIDPEDALRQANLKFERRFGHIERSLRQAGRSLQEASFDEMEALWHEAKRLEKRSE